ncbi:choline dehydrogenase [Exophiala aquamarina CBS 119918]|uniref:Choline dehydrogenase n=1 Tax=Exophiala aquamarina CBS 119918 TaxID=1182545 RepID=A0A072PQ99_9EURO|nr:choline dehydrogenase [Exophiala aquamarina CBS 119918]KEF57685.1 choline dehydrogenase [Exophiala aquamarina CBS 119918]
MTTTQLSSSETNSYDYLIVGGGTAGCVIASRLAEYLPHKKILLIEAGPSDFMDDRVLDLKQWLNLLGGELDYDYGTTEQPNGNSHIRHSRAKVLGGCSSHNTLISFRPFEYDCKIWESLGAKGWTFPMFTRVLNKLRNTVQPVHARHRNQLCKDWVNSCSTAMDIPVVHDFNKEITSTGSLKPCVGFFSVSYNPDDGRRSSASVAYIHPILREEEKRPNLKILTNAWVSKINIDKNDSVTGVDITLQSGEKHSLTARTETVLCAGAVDTPRLMLLSGLGPKDQLASLSIPVVKNMPGVGENLLDHPETIIIWELNKPVPPNQTTMDSDAGIFLRRQAADAAATNPSAVFNPKSLADGDIADVMMHCYQIPFCLNTTRLGYDTPIDAFCMTPNIPRPRSRGRLYLTSSDPTVKPALDFRYFTDPEGYDAATFVFGLRAARKIAQQAPFKDWIKREVAPGNKVQSDEELSEYARRVAHTVYHPAGTTKMGDVRNDEFAVVDETLKVRGLKRLRIADAGVFPAMPTINPMLTVLGVGERAAELIATEAGWKGEGAVQARL